MTSNNGFPVLTIHDLLDAWKIGNMALGWARQPLALDNVQLEMFVDLCRRYNLEPAEVLMQFQGIAFPDLLQKRLAASRSGEEMPEISGAGVPYPSPQPRPRAAEDPQSGDLGWTSDGEGGPFPVPDEQRETDEEYLQKHHRSDGVT